MVLHTVLKAVCKGWEHKTYGVNPTLRVVLGVSVLCNLVTSVYSITLCHYLHLSQTQSRFCSCFKKHATILLVCAQTQNCRALDHDNIVMWGQSLVECKQGIMH